MKPMTQVIDKVHTRVSNIKLDLIDAAIYNIDNKSYSKASINIMRRSLSEPLIPVTTATAIFNFNISDIKSMVE